MRYFIYTIFLSAFLLFQVQPMIARFILPWYGGSAAVWSTSLVFFQAGLLMGYGYSHLLTKYLSNKSQVKFHMALLILSLVTLPIIPPEWLKPSGTENPVYAIILLLGVSVGLPFILVSTTGPLLQSWHSKAYPKQRTYRLYALSNLGSLLGLFTYPVLVEPYLNLKTQAWFWSAGYLLFIILCSLAARKLWNLKTPQVGKEAEKKEHIGLIHQIIWLLLAMMGTATLLSGTNKLTQDIAVVPFLWIIPLSLYLLTFIIAFDSPRWYKRGVFIPMALLSIAFILRRQIQFVVFDKEMPVNTTIFIYCLGVFAICMVLHGELARQKPSEKNLTLFYLMVSLGGVLGGIFINMIAPLIFSGYWEIYCAFIGSAIVVTYVLLRGKNSLKGSTMRTSSGVASVILVAAMFVTLQHEYKGFNKNVIASSRNFYGALKVSEANKGTPNWQRMLVHGDIMHGIEFMDPDASNKPISYYGPESGIGLALRFYANRSDSNYHGIKVGMVGLGAGTISAFGSSKDYYRYYELNPQVEDMAKAYFRYLDNFTGKTDIIIGDGRISLERELAENGSDQFDILGVDAFSGDVIPAHLITIEAAQLYLKHLKQNGILAFHVTNKYLDLLPVMMGLSEKLNKPLYYFFQEADLSGPVSAIWILFTDNQKFLHNPEVKKHLQLINPSETEKVFWTDDYSSILPLYF